MPAITASMVAELRAKTDAPMMECKKALTEAEGNLDKAEEFYGKLLGDRAGVLLLRAARGSEYGGGSECDCGDQCGRCRGGDGSARPCRVHSVALLRR